MLTLLFIILMPCQVHVHALLFNAPFKLTWAEGLSKLSRSLVVYSSFCKHFTFPSPSPESLGQFQPNLAQTILKFRSKWRALFTLVFFSGSINFNQTYTRKHLWVKGIQIVQMNGHALSQREMIMAFKQPTCIIIALLKFIYLLLGIISH